ncbi:MAG: outer membrane beta-barrel domain-containing protein [Bdellovibrionaceae bacterium]|nr:outer membrane beta-barrel domain-containing protein [Pseudobdellovibrionaceae bacterium]
MKKLWMAIILGAVSLSVQTTTAFAQSKRINTRQLVEDYWTPQEKKYALIQKRYFVKEGRPMLSATGGIHVNNPQHDGYFGTLSLGYYFTEKWGIEGHYSTSSLQNNDLIKELEDLSSGAATLNRGKTKSYMGASINYSPIYAKMSLLGYKILYFDLILSGHLGQTTYEQARDTGSPTQSALTFGVGLSQIFYLNKHWSVRFDFTNRWYNSEVVEYDTGSKVKDRWINDTMLGIGATVML